MSAVITIAIVTCFLMIACILLKPSIEIHHFTLSLYWIIVLVGAMVLLASGLISISTVVDGLTADTSINPIKILILFLSMTIQSIFLDEVGFFRYLAGVTLRKARTSQKTLFLYLYLMVSVLTVFTSNDIIILTFTPFICYFAKNAQIDPIPYLFAEFVAANTWSMALVIGNPTNVYLATAGGIGFLPYTSVMLVPTFCGGVVAFLILYLLFRKKLSKPIEVSDSLYMIQNRKLLVIGLIHLISCTVLLVISSYIGIEMWAITLGFAISLSVCVLICYLLTRTGASEMKYCLKRAPWELIPFVLSMFVLVLALDEYGVTHMLGQLLSRGIPLFTYGAASFLAANLMNNIPMSVLFSAVMEGASGHDYTMAIYATIAGSNLGALFTPIGALAGIMWTSILRKHDIPFSFGTFIRYGVCISIPTLIATLLGLWVVLSC